MLQEDGHKCIEVMESNNLNQWKTSANICVVYQLKFKEGLDNHKWWRKKTGGGNDNMLRKPNPK